MVEKRAAAALRELRRPVRWSIRLGTVLAALSAIAGLAPFIGLAGLVDALLDENEQTAWRWCALIAIGLAGRALLMGTALGVTHFADVRLQGEIRRQLVTHLSRVPLGWFTRTSSGRVRKAAIGDVHDLHQMVAHHAVEMTAAIVMPVAALVYLAFLDWRLIIMAVTVLPLYAIAYAWMMRGYGEQMTRLDEANARISAAVVEFVSGIAVVKTFGQSQRAYAAYRDAARDFTRFFGSWVGPMLRVEALASMAISAPVVGLVALALGVWYVDQGWVSVGEALTGVLLTLVIPTVITPLGFGAQFRRTAMAAAGRIDEMLQTPTLPVTPHPEDPNGHAVDFDQVSFSYDGETEVLRDVTLRCAPGTVTALVGPSGAGKSTLATLVPRFHDVEGGAVRLGGVDVRRIAPEVLYRNVGFVLQDVALLHTNIADNVRLGRPGASDEEIRNVCIAAQIHERVIALPRGYDSVVGEDAQLSGGEAQRLSIARALLADTPVIVLDEATAFADPDSEAAIQDALSTLARGRTVLVIAHRLSTITAVDQIAVVEDGRIVQTGTHRELTEVDGPYARMWRAHKNIPTAPGVLS